MSTATSPVDSSTPNLGPDWWTELRVFAEMLDDAMRARIAAKNRAERGGIDAAPFAPLIVGMEDADHQIGLALGRCYRRVVPSAIVAWQEDTLGIGDRLLARLLGVIGHPVHTRKHRWEGTGGDRVLVDLGPYERRVSDLWSYCGHGDATRKRVKGMTADQAAAMGSPRAKMLVHLLSEGAVKEPRRRIADLLDGNQLLGGASWPYRHVYESTRVAVEDRDDWTDAHKHAHALRLVGKEILRDLWAVAKEES